MSCEKSSLDQADDAIDPRVQVELERLNTATDEINKLEVDLDESRNQFRLLLSESTFHIENVAKKLGSCIEKARPYYDARLKAKEALQETQKAAVNFERANSAHAAAKEMVYLAEEGLKTEGRTFDHAWQEMLNHATMRVNESESERMRLEGEHKRTSLKYQQAEIRVQQLQKELKKAITKSRPYFELKIRYNQLLEQQKNKVKSLEKQVSQVKTSYADTLRNLEQISDEIHKTRQNNDPSRGKRENEKESLSICAKVETETETEWRLSDKSQNKGDSPKSENDSSLTGPTTDSESEDEFFKLPEKLSSKAYPDILKGTSNCLSSRDLKDVADRDGKESTTIKADRKSECDPYFEGVGICSFPTPDDSDVNFEEDKNASSVWTEVRLDSSEDDDRFLTVKKGRTNKSEFDIPYAPLSSEAEPEGAADENEKEDFLENASKKEEPKTLDEERRVRSLKNTPRKTNARRQSLDVLWNNATGEKVKEILSQSILKLNISSLTERRSSESKIDSTLFQGVGNEMENEENEKGENVGSQFGLQFFNKRNVKGNRVSTSSSEEKRGSESFSNQIGGLISKKERLFPKKVPSPLERTFGYLNPEETDSNSDTESLASVDMLSDEQLSSLVLDQDLRDIYQDIVL